MFIHILPKAMEDLYRGRDFYATQAEELGEYFRDSLKADIDSLKLYAGMHPIFFETYFRMLSKRFPFAIYYRVEGQNIYIDAVLDCRQNPETIRDRMEPC